MGIQHIYVNKIMTDLQYDFMYFHYWSKVLSFLIIVPPIIAYKNTYLCNVNYINYKN